MKLSILQKASLTLVPLSICSALTGVIAFRSLNKSTDQVVETSKIVELALKAQTFSILSSNHLRGFLLDPNNADEMKQKEAADSEHQAAIENMMLLTEVPDIFRLIEREAEIAEGQLAPLEVKITELSKNGDLKGAQSMYFSEYMPARELYAKNAEELIEASKKIAAAEATKIGEQMKDAFKYIVVSLTCGMVIVGLSQIFIGLGLARTLKRLASELTGNAEEVAETSEKVFENSNQLSDRTNTQSAAVQQTASSVEEVSAMADRNAEGAQQSESYTLKSEEVLNQGRSTIERMVHAIQDIRLGNEDFARQMETGNQELSEIARVISEITAKTKVINDIVFQTKLLSFNASVEAARAGEAGKGFAVVAEEVGNLAQMSGQAAKEISSILSQSMQRVTSIIENTKTRMENFLRVGSDKVEVGTSVADETRMIFDEIFTHASKVRQMVTQIAVSSREQTEGVKGINEAINQIDQITLENAEAAGESAETAERLQSQATRLQDVAEELLITVTGQLKKSKGSKGENNTDDSQMDEDQSTETYDSTLNSDDSELAS